jgi:hypothetical protein
MQQERPSTGKRERVVVPVVLGRLKCACQALHGADVDFCALRPSQFRLHKDAPDAFVAGWSAGNWKFTSDRPGKFGWIGRFPPGDIAFDHRPSLLAVQ